MRRHLEPVDLVVAVGLMATVFGGALFFLTTEGALQAGATQPAPIGSAMGATDGMQWVQPALGQAIVDDYLLEWNLAQHAVGLVTELNRATVADHRLRTTPFGYLERVRAMAGRIEEDHLARVQYVMGRTIVAFTDRGVRERALSAERSDTPFNRRLIGTARDIGERMDRSFYSGWQARLGEMIVSAGVTQARMVEESQQRIGSAIVRLAAVQDRYLSARDASQQQLAAITVAALHAEQAADRFARLASADRLAQEPGATLPLSEPISLPEVPYGYLLLASLALTGLFFVGLSLPGFRPESGAARSAEAEARVEHTFRKTG
jgi:hypothetical protein